MAAFIKFNFIDKVGEKEENAKSQDGGNNTPSLLIFKLNKLNFLLYFSTYTMWVNILWHVKKILGLIIYVLYSFTHTFYTFYIGLFYARIVCSMA